MKHTLTIGWLYPDLMSTYGDRGNIICMTKRALWRDITITVVPIDHKTAEKDLASIDILFGGGAQDREQEIVMRDLMRKKVRIKDRIDNAMPALFVCGSPQLMGNYYEPSVGKQIAGLGIFDMVSVHPGPNADRLIGNIVADVLWNNLGVTKKPSKIVGFENHGGRTTLGKNARPFAKVIKGFGNNGTDGTEGVVYNNAIGCYFHGPLLPKNPEIADHLLMRALAVKYKTPISLEDLDDSLESKAQIAIARRLGVEL